MSAKNNLIKILAGGAIGSVITLLFAPKSGKVIRKGIKNKTDEYFDEAEKIIQDAQKKARAIINDGMRKSEDLITNAKIKSDELLSKAESIISKPENKTTKAITINKESVDRKLRKADLRNSAKNKEVVDITKLKTGFRNNKIEHRDKRHKDKFD
jgi:gas vesicle protein